MSHRSIASRFAPPRARAHVVRRDRLIARLAAAQRPRLVLLNAGAGYGKTTLLMQWRQMLVGEGMAVAWLSAGPMDCTPRQFCASLTDALRHADLPAAAVLDRLMDDLALDIAAALVPVLVNAVAASEATVHLLIDDFHHLCSPAVTGIVQALIDEAPRNLQLVLSTRVRPELRLGRLHALDELVELDSAALAFDLPESVAFLSARLGHAATPELARAVHDSVDGWPAGLQFYANEAARDVASRPQHLLRASSRLAAYFEEEVIGGLSPRLQAQLEALSILPRFDTRLAAAVTGASDVQAGIDYALSHNLFLTPDPGSHGHHWLRLHPLFASHLRERLRTSGRDMAGLHRTAAESFERTGHLAEAVQQAILGGDLDATVALIRRSAPGLGLPVIRQLRGWLKVLPLAALSRHPDILARLAWACVLMQLPEEAQRCIDAIRPPEGTGHCVADVSLLQATIAIHHDNVAACMAVLPMAPAGGWGELQRQVHAALTITCLARSGRFDEANACYHAAGTQAALASQRGLAYVATMAAARAQWLEGHVHEAQRMASEVLASVPAILRPTSATTCHAAVLLAEILCERECFDAARSMLVECEPMLRATLPATRIGAALARARLPAAGESPAQRTGQLAHAEAAFRRDGQLRGAAHMSAEQVRMLAASGALRHCEGHVLALDALVADNQRNGPDADEIALLAALSGARFALAMQRPAEALSRCDVAAELAKRYGRKPLAIKARLLRAVACAAMGREAIALELARSVIDDGMRTGLLHSLRDEGPAWRDLLGRLSCADDLALESYRYRLAAPLSVTAASTAPAIPAALVNMAAALPTYAATPRQPASPFRALTPRERQIMELVEQGMPNKRIAHMLGLSLDTIKWNIKNIFGKLRVSSRYEAILAMRQQARMQVS
ncbi:LuxR C-terminal-related transcriptional regulator [Cupriavidus sp. NPDC089707]|uniref:LuxR C-terminal-related transcriptional regulator n=1 Tax=Cupriavidus sp. NPDC089707 TaxID=3363963 RepID=UPI00382D87F3